MPGPSSPKRQAKQAKAKEKAKAAIQNFNVPASYRPATNSIVLSLPTELTAAGKSWWDDWGGKNNEFDKAKANKGSLQGVMGWVRQKFILDWWNVHFPQAKHVSTNDRAWYFRESGIGRKIYAHLDNWVKRRAEEWKPEETEPPARTSTTPPEDLKTRAYGHDSWRRENPDLYQEAIRIWKEEQERDPTIGEARAVSSAAFKKLSPQEQEKWRAKAKAALKTNRELAKITDPQARVKYVEGILKQHRSFMKEVAEIAGVQLCTLVVYEKVDGKFHIGRELSEGLRGFAKAPSLTQTMTDMQKFVRTTINLSIENPTPEPTVYPDYSRDNIPMIPNYVGWKREQLRDLMRTFMKAMYVFQGGIGRPMWKEIKKSLKYWFDPTRLPENAEWDDPSLLAMSVVTVWLDFFLACQTGKVPLKNRFQFLRVVAGESPIHPSDSQETGREVINRNEKELFVLVFDETVTKCHRVGGMVYKKGAIDFADFLSFGGAHSNAPTAPPKRWQLLPTANPTIPTAVISGVEQERIFTLAGLMPDTGRNRVIRLVDAANEHQSHIPATHPKGVWLRVGGPPQLIPQSPQTSDSSPSMWMPKCYFEPPGVGPANGHVYFIELWQKDLRETDVIRHEASKTFYGGGTGIVWVVRALIQLYLNCCAIRGDFDSPEDAPEDYDLTRFNVHDHDRIAEWIDDWILAIEQSTEILRETSEERKQGLATNGSEPEESAANANSILDGPSTSATPIPTSPVSSAILPGAPAPAKSAKRAKRVRISTDDSDETDPGPDLDYDNLDKTPQDSDWSDEEDWNIRHPTDDVFPPDDPVGLRARYGFDPKVPHQVIDGTGPEKILPAWTRTDSVFGEFPKLSPYVAPRLTCPKSVVSQLDAVDEQAERAKARWIQFSQENPRLTSSLRQKAKELSSVLADDIEPIYRAFFQRQVAWMRARALAPVVFAHWEAMAYILREGMQLYLTAQKIIERDDFSDSEITAEYLANRVIESKKNIIDLQYICSELRAWNKLAAKYYNNSKAPWLCRKAPDRGAKLASFAQMMADWADETYQLGATLVEKRSERWDKILDVPFEDNAPHSVYLFGCPSQKELPKDLQDAINILLADGAPDSTGSIPNTDHAGPTSAPAITPAVPDSGVEDTAVAPTAEPEHTRPRPRPKPKPNVTPPPSAAKSPSAGGPTPTAEAPPSVTPTVDPAPEITITPVPEVTPEGAQGMDLDEQTQRSGIATPASSDAPSLSFLQEAPPSPILDSNATHPPPVTDSSDPPPPPATVSTAPPPPDPKSTKATRKRKVAPDIMEPTRASTRSRRTSEPDKTNTKASEPVKASTKAKDTSEPRRVQPRRGSRK